jgi:feruloyl esterase
MIAGSMIVTAVCAAEQGKEVPLTAGNALHLPAVAAVADCPSLASLNVSQNAGALVRITSAKIISNGKAGSYCKVDVEADDYARFELRLPIANWTQRLLFAGGFGQSPPAMLSQFASVSWRDLGNRGNEDVFASNYQYRVNFAYRAMHLQVLAAKAIIAKYYNQGPRFSYYDACSEPGREGMMEVQRFPEDFDGVAAGCPPINDTVNNGLFYAWNILANTGKQGTPIITTEKLPVLHKAVLDECDAADGANDGIISDPFHCHPQLTAVECKPDQDRSSCLTSEQVHAALELYRGAHDDQGNKLAPSGVLPGSELSWAGVIVPKPRAPGQPAGPDDRTGTKLAIRSEFNDPPLPTSFTLSDFRFDRATFAAITKLHPLYDATDPDLSAFAKAGHKLILWQSLGDTNVLPAHAILYYDALQNTLGSQAVEQFVRFYVLPGVFHCGGGNGPAIRDFLSPLMAWVELGIAPGVLLATHIPGATGSFSPSSGSATFAPDLSRPVYPYPYTAKYAGRGNVKDAHNFVQGPALRPPQELFNWLGSGFYTPDYEKWCTGTGTVLQCKDSR